MHMFDGPSAAAASANLLSSPASITSAGPANTFTNAAITVGRSKLTTGLNLLNVTRLDFFPQPLQAEVFRLKGEIMRRVGDGDGAQTAFSTAVSLHKSSPKGWFSWACFCDQVGGWGLAWYHQVGCQ